MSLKECIASEIMKALKQSNLFFSFPKETTDEHSVAKFQIATYFVITESGHYFENSPVFF